MDKIAIIAPVFNTAEYLSEMIDSVLKQTFSNFVLILIDDCSTDNSLGICKKYADEDKRIKVISLNNNSGPGVARNKGLEYVRSKKQLFKYFTFIDSDDYVEENYLSTLVNALKASNCNIAVTSYTSSVFLPFESTTEIKSNLFYKNRKVYRYYPSNCPHSKLFGIKLIDKAFFPENIAHEDIFLIPRIILCEENILLVEAKLYYYRLRKNSESHIDHFHINMLDRLDGLQSNLDYVRNHNIDAAYHFVNEYFEYLDWLIIFSKKENSDIAKELVKRKKDSLSKYAGYIKDKCTIVDYYRYKYGANSLVFKALDRFYKRKN